MNDFIAVTNLTTNTLVYINVNQIAWVDVDNRNIYMATKQIISINSNDMVKVIQNL